MSGVKRATVQRKLNQAIAVIDGQMRILEQMGDQKANIGRKEYVVQKQQAETAFNSLSTSIPNEIRAYVENEVRNLNSQYSALRQLLANVKNIEQAYNQAYEQASDLLTGARRDINKVRTDCKNLEQRISYNTYGYLDAEDSEARVLRWKANDAQKKAAEGVAAFENAEAKLRDTRAGYNSVVTGCRNYQLEYDRIVKLGRSRLEAHKIAEENKRQAIILANSLASLAQAIESHNPDKFAPGEFNRQELARIAQLVENGKYEEALNTGHLLESKLIQLQNKVENAHNAWLEKQSQAALAIETCEVEYQNIDKKLLDEFSGMTQEELQRIYDAIANLPLLMKEENFDEVIEQVGFILEALRKLSEDANNRRNKFNERQEIANAIMQALCDANYNAPEFGFAKDENGNDDKLGNLHIFASSPSGIADMKMQIGMDGQVKMEVENVKEGSEELCVNALKELRSRTQDMGIDFTVTDWGRASNHQATKLPDASQIKDKEQYRTKQH